MTRSGFLENEYLFDEKIEAPGKFPSVRSKIRASWKKQYFFDKQKGLTYTYDFPGGPMLSNRNDQVTIHGKKVLPTCGNFSIFPELSRNFPASPCNYSRKIPESPRYISRKSPIYFPQDPRIQQPVTSRIPQFPGT